MENPNYYAIIPATVRYSNITPNAKLLYGEITALSNKHGYCYASNAYFSSLYGVSKTSINNWINELIDNKFISREIVYAENSKEVVNRYLRIVDHPMQENLEGSPKNLDHPMQENLEGSPKNLDHPMQENLEGSPKNLAYNNTLNNTYNITSNNPTGMGENSNKTNILGNNNQISQPSQPAPQAPRVKAPVIKASAKIPNEIQAKLNEWNDYPETKKALEDYCLFCLDTYNLPKTTLKHKVNQICKMANNVPKGIEIICEYNITGNYKTVFKPSYYNKVLSESSVVSKAYEGDFVRDEEGNIEEIW
jgi:hypothetical protein